MKPCPVHFITLVLLCLHGLIVAGNDCISFDKFATCTDLLQVTSLPPKTETLVITGGSVKTVSGYSFSHLPKLTELNIQHMRIGIINKNAFSDLPNLDLLSISNSNVSIIETGAFHGLRGLSSFDISQNKIDAIEFKAFSNMENIIEITIKTNNISFIDSSAFYNFLSIRTFQFYENNVSVVKASAFSEWNDVMNAIVNSNTFGRFECMTDSLFTVATSFTFFMNQLQCECHLAWILTSSLLKDKLLSNVCQVPGTQESLGMSTVSLADLTCPTNPSPAQTGCPNRPDKTSASFTSDVTVMISAPSSLQTRGPITTDDTTDLSSTDYTGSTTHDETHSSGTVTHFTRTSFMSSHSSSHVTGMDVSASTELPIASPSSSGQSSTGSVQATSTLTLLITAAISVS